METILASNVTSKGQVTIPAKVRKELGIDQGTVIGFQPWKDGAYLIRPLEQDPLDALKGFLHYTGPTVSLDDMDEAIAQAALGRNEA